MTTDDERDPRHPETVRAAAPAAPDAAAPKPGLSRRAVLTTGAAAALAAGFARGGLAQGHGAHGAAHAEPAPAAPAPGKRTAPRRAQAGDLPWSEAERRRYAPGEPGRDYTPVHTPNGATLPFKVVGGVKVFHLVAEEIVHDLAEGLTVHAWGFNGRTPGPTIEVLQGDRVRFYVTNRLPVATSVHWHGVILPAGMDGVPGITQPLIPPGETFVYEYTVFHAGTFMYHPHSDSMTEEGLGMIGMLVVHPRDARERRPDRDYAIALAEWKVPGGTRRPDPNEMVDFNVLTMNGKAFPDTAPLVAQLGERVRIRIGNLSQMSHHPIHLHGYSFRVTDTDGGAIPRAAQWPETTVLVPVGATRTIELEADNPGDWLMHCHMTHHMMNQMGHGLPNMIGVDVTGVEEKVQALLPAYMTMGQNGMEDMASMAGHMQMPENSIPMRGVRGQFGPTVMGGMATMLKVRERLVGYEDPGPYDFPAGTVSYPASSAQLSADGIELPPPAEPRATAHRHARREPLPGGPTPEARFMIDELLSWTELPNLHPALVHFPIAFTLLALLFDLAAVTRSERSWLDRAATATWVAAGLGAGAAFWAGRVAADSLLVAPRLQARINAHADWGLYTVWTVGVLAALRLGFTLWDNRRRETRGRRPALIVFVLAGLAAVGVVGRTADLGGGLVFRHGVAVLAADTADTADTTGEEGAVDAPEDDVPRPPSGEPPL